MQYTEQLKTPLDMVSRSGKGSCKIVLIPANVHEALEEQTLTFGEDNEVSVVQDHAKVLLTNLKSRHRENGCRMFAEWKHLEGVRAVYPALAGVGLKGMPQVCGVCKSCSFKFAYCSRHTSDH